MTTPSSPTTPSTTTTPNSISSISSSTCVVKNHVVSTFDPLGLCVFIAIAEFDVDHGNCVAALYPDIPSLDAQSDYLADKMLCDGAERHEELTTWFTMSLQLPAQLQPNNNHESTVIYC
eukprot:PhM_4_TR14083/c1_g1_i4/m.107002